MKIQEEKVYIDHNVNEYKSIRDYAYDTIRRNILRLTFQPGQKITELELVDLLKVGKTPIREALILLAKESLINIMPQSGSFISKINLQAVNEGNEIRNLIEQDVHIKASKLITDACIKKCRLVLSRHELSDEDIETHWEYDEKFHYYLYSICNRLHTFQWIQQLNFDYNRVRYLALVDLPKKQDIINEHSAILDAIESKDEGLIRETTHKHLNRLTIEKDVLIEHHKEYFIV